MTYVYCYVSSENQVSQKCTFNIISKAHADVICCHRLYTCTSLCLTANINIQYYQHISSIYLIQSIVLLIHVLALGIL